jgi:hypothetical protein
MKIDKTTKRLSIKDVMDWYYGFDNYSADNVATKKLAASLDAIAKKGEEYPEFPEVICMKKQFETIDIADYLGWEKTERGYMVPNLYPIFHKEDGESTGETEQRLHLIDFKKWEWLMPVVRKILREKIGDGESTVEFPYFRTLGLNQENREEYMARINGHALFLGDSLLGAMYLSVVDFCGIQNRLKSK